MVALGQENPSQGSPFRGMDCHILYKYYKKSIITPACLPQTLRNSYLRKNTIRISYECEGGKEKK